VSTIKYEQEELKLAKKLGGNMKEIAEKVEENEKWTPK
jgi:hypothetical protein